MTILRPLWFLALVASLSACTTLPRGAGLQSEILGVSHALGMADETPDFAVETVTRDNLAAFAAWPRVGEDRLSWIERVDQPNNRIIAPGDLLSITIWSTEDNGLLTTAGQRFVNLPEMRVSASGTVFLPYIGTLRVAGMAPETARARIEDQYLIVTPSAQVQLEMQEGRQNTVSLVSGVLRPGSYPLPDRDFTVMALIAEGGGIAANLDNPQVRLQRGDRLFGISVDRLLDTPRLDTTLRGGDKVFVEEDERYFLSLGAAGSESLHPFPKDHVTALDAMSIIGGLNDSSADPQGILILRRYAPADVRPDGTGPRHERTVFTIDLTSADGLFSAGQFHIQSGDLVYASESPLTSARTIIGVLATSLGVLNTATNLQN